MKKFRKVSLLLVFIMMFTVVSTACSSKKDSGENNKSSNGVITINFPSIWVGSDSKAEIFGKMVTDFNEEYKDKYKVVIEEQTDYDAYEDKVRTQISTGSAPDIFTVKTIEDVKLFASSGLLMDLTEFLEGDIKSNFEDDAIEKAKEDGKNFAFPYENATIPIMFNAKLLKDQGIEIPTTYDELWEASEILKKNGIYPTTQMTSDNAWTSMLWYSYALASVGGEDVYKNGLTDPAFIEAAEILLKMFDYTSDDAIGANATVVNGHFFNERAAVYTNGSWILGRIQSEGKEGLYDKLTLSGALGYKDKNQGAYINAVQAYFCAAKQEDPKKQEAIEKFFEFITNPEKVTDLANSSGALFSIKINADDIEDPKQAEIINQNSEAPFTIESFSASVSTKVANAFPAALESLVLKEISPKEFVQQLIDADK